MKKIFSILPRWIPSLLIMSVIFYLSSQPGTELPFFFSWDYVVKKSGHFFGYALLALTFLYAFEFNPRFDFRAVLFALLYAASDEFHQMFVPGRGPSLVDVFFFDGLGALCAIFIYRKFFRSVKHEKEIDSA